jgi:hypothetical protein
MKSILKISTAVAALSSFGIPFGNSSFGAPAEVAFSEKLTIKGSELLLNGKGSRKATLFAIKVYDAAFYNPTPAKTEEQVLASAFPKSLHIRYVRDFDLEKTKEAWKYQFKESALIPENEYIDGLQKLISFQKPIQEGTLHRFDIQKEKVTFYINEDAQGEISGEGFQKALLNVFFSKNPPTKELKKGLLGEARD